MIFGKSRKEKYQARQDKLKKDYLVLKKNFAIFPHGLYNDRIAWLQYVYWIPPIWKDEGGTYSNLGFWNPGRTYYSSPEEPKRIISELRKNEEKK